jgi:hypothetical protein
MKFFIGTLFNNAINMFQIMPVIQTGWETSDEVEASKDRKRNASLAR